MLYHTMYDSEWDFGICIGDILLGEYTNPQAKQGIKNRVHRNSFIDDIDRYYVQ